MNNRLLELRQQMLAKIKQDDTINFVQEVLRKPSTDTPLVNLTSSLAASESQQLTEVEILNRIDEDSYIRLSNNLRRKSGEILQGQHRVQFCGKVPVWNNDTKLITLRKNEKEGLFYSGLATCGSVWTCPVCATKIMKKRQNQVSDILSKSDKLGYSIGFITVTVAHYKEFSAKYIKEIVTESWEKLLAERKFREAKQRHKIIGYIRALETTVTEKNGFHPHLHVAFIGDCSYESLEKFGEIVKEVWLTVVARFGHQANYEQQHYTAMYQKGNSNVADGIADYITKWNICKELTQGHVKMGKDNNILSGRSPFKILMNITDLTSKNLDEDKEIYNEYAVAFKGARLLTFSKNLKTLFSVEEIEDEDIANEQIEAEKILTITDVLWAIIWKLRIDVDLKLGYKYGGIKGFTKILNEKKVKFVYNREKQQFDLIESEKPKPPTPKEIEAEKKLQEFRELISTEFQGNKKIEDAPKVLRTQADLKLNVHYDPSPILLCKRNGERKYFDKRGFSLDYGVRRKPRKKKPVEPVQGNLFDPVPVQSSDDGFGSFGTFYDEFCAEIQRNKEAMELPEAPKLIDITNTMVNSHFESNTLFNPYPVDRKQYLKDLGDVFFTSNGNVIEKKLDRKTIKKLRRKK